MDASKFRIAGRQMVDFVADYLESIEDRPVVPNIKPGDIFRSIPNTPPEVCSSNEFLTQ